MPCYRIEWSEDAKGDVRRLDRVTAMRVFEAILHYARTGAGDVAPLRGNMTGSSRLRVGDHRVFFRLREAAIVIWSASSA